jgi:hypothetical protein
MLDTPVPPDALHVLLIRLRCRLSFAGVMRQEAGIGTGGVVRCRASTGTAQIAQQKMGYALAGEYFHYAFKGAERAGPGTTVRVCYLTAE